VSGPLFDASLTSDARWPQIRSIVATRTSAMLAAFRAASR
jgi:hypothetical protein